MYIYTYVYIYIYYVYSYICILYSYIYDIYIVICIYYIYMPYMCHGQVKLDWIIPVLTGGCGLLPSSLDSHDMGWMAIKHIQITP